MEVSPGFLKGNNLGHERANHVSGYEAGEELGFFCFHPHHVPVGVPPEEADDGLGWGV